MDGRIGGGGAIAEEAAEEGGRLYGVSSLHACDDGSRIAVRTRGKGRGEGRQGEGMGDIKCPVKRDVINLERFPVSFS